MCPQAVSLQPPWWGSDIQVAVQSPSPPIPETTDWRRAAFRLREKRPRAEVIGTLQSEFQWSKLSFRNIRGLGLLKRSGRYDARSAYSTNSTKFPSGSLAKIAVIPFRMLTGPLLITSTLNFS